MTVFPALQMNPRYIESKRIATSTISSSDGRSEQDVVDADHPDGLHASPAVGGRPNPAEQFYA